MRFGPDITPQEDLADKFLAKRGKRFTKPGTPKTGITLGLEPVDINQNLLTFPDQGASPFDMEPVSLSHLGGAGSMPAANVPRQEQSVGEFPATRFTPAYSTDPLAATMEVYDLNKYGRPTRGMVDDPERSQFRDAADSLIRSGEASDKPTNIYYQTMERLGRHEIDPANLSLSQQRAMEPYTLENAMLAWDMVKYGRPTFGYVDDPERLRVRDELNKLTRPQVAGRDQMDVTTNEQNRILGRALDQPGSRQPHEIPPNDVIHFLWQSAGNDPVKKARMEKVVKGLLAPGVAGMSPEQARFQSGITYDPIMSPDAHPGSLGQTALNLFKGGLAGLQAQATGSESVFALQQDTVDGTTPHGFAMQVAESIVPWTPYLIPGIGRGRIGTLAFQSEVAGAVMKADSLRGVVENINHLLPFEQVGQLFDPDIPAGTKVGNILGLALGLHGAYKTFKGTLPIGKRMPEKISEATKAEWESAVREVYPDLTPEQSSKLADEIKVTTSHLDDATKVKDIDQVAAGKMSFEQWMSKHPDSNQGEVAAAFSAALVRQEIPGAARQLAQADAGVIVKSNLNKEGDWAVETQATIEAIDKEIRKKASKISKGDYGGLTPAKARAEIRQLEQARADLVTSLSTGQPNEAILAQMREGVKPAVSETRPGEVPQETTPTAEKPTPAAEAKAAEPVATPPVEAKPKEAVPPSTAEQPIETPAAKPLSLLPEEPTNEAQQGRQGRQELQAEPEQKAAQQEEKQAKEVAPGNRHEGLVYSIDSDGLTLHERTAEEGDHFSTNEPGFSTKDTGGDPYTLPKGKTLDLYALEMDQTIDAHALLPTGTYHALGKVDPHGNEALAAVVKKAARKGEVNGTTLTKFFTDHDPSNPGDAWGILSAELKKQGFNAVKIHDTVLPLAGVEPVRGKAAPKPVAVATRAPDEAPKPLTADEIASTTTEETIPGTKNIAVRLENGYRNFVATLMEAHGYSRADAELLTDTYLKEKLATQDAGDGRIKVKHGADLDKQNLDAVLEIAKEGQQPLTSASETPAPKATSVVKAEDSPAVKDAKLTQAQERAMPKDTVDVDAVPIPRGMPKELQVHWVDVNDIKVNSQIQYKDVPDKKTMTGNALKGVDAYDLRQGGILSVWKRLNGELQIIHGHHRLDLAQRAKTFGYTDRTLTMLEVAERKIPVNIFEEADGWTLKDVRVHAALENLRNGDGTALDAVFALKEANLNIEAFRRLGVKVAGNLQRNTVGLLRASGDLLEMVRRKSVTEDAAAGVASIEELNANDHSAAAALIDKLNIRTFEDARVAAWNYAQSILDSTIGAKQQVLGDGDDTWANTKSATSIETQTRLQIAVRNAVVAKLRNIKSGTSIETFNENEIIDVEARNAYLEAVAKDSKGAMVWKADMVLKNFGDVRAFVREMAAAVDKGDLTEPEARSKIAQMVEGIVLQNLSANEFITGRPDPAITATMQVDNPGFTPDTETPELFRAKGKAATERRQRSIKNKVAMDSADFMAAMQKRGDPVDIERVPGKKPKPVRQIIRDFESALAKAMQELGRKSSQGILGTSKAQTAGVYQIESRARFSKGHTDFATMMHEAGHMLHDLFLGKIPMGLLKELKDSRLGTTSLPDYTPWQQMAEGVAEYVRWRLAAPAAAAEHFPLLTQWYEGTVPKEMQSVFEAFGQDVRQFAGASPESRYGALVTLGDHQRAGLKESLKKALQIAQTFNQTKSEYSDYQTSGKDKLRMLFVDRAAPIDSLLAEMFKRAGIEQGKSHAPNMPEGVLPAENPATYVRLIPYVDKKVEASLIHGFQHLDGQDAVEPLTHMLSNLYKDDARPQSDILQEWAGWMAAKRHAERFAINDAKAAEEIETWTRRQEERWGERAQNRFYSAVVDLKNQAAVLVAELKGKYDQMAKDAPDAKAKARAEAEFKEKTELVNQKLKQAIDRERQKASNWQRSQTEKAVKRGTKAIKVKWETRSADILPTSGGFKGDARADAIAARDAFLGDYPKSLRYQAADQWYQKWADWHLRLLEDSGFLDAAQAKLVRERNQDYFSFRRDLSTEMRNMEHDEFRKWLTSENGAGGQGGLAIKRRPMEILKGADAPLMDPLEAIVAMTAKALHASTQNLVGKTFLDLFATPREFHGKDTILSDIMIRLPDTPAPEKAHPFAEGKLAKVAAGDENVITVWRDGQKESWRIIDDTLAQTWKKHVTSTISDPIVRGALYWLSLPGQALKWGVTRFLPFQIRNIIRDSEHAYSMSPYSLKGVGQRAGSIIELAKNADGIWKMKEQLEARDKAAESEYGHLGKGLSRVEMFEDGIGWDKAVPHIQRKVTQATQTGRGTKHFFADPVEGFRIGNEKFGRFMEKFETYNREKVFEAARDYALKELGYDKHNADLYGAAESRRIMLDFRKSGEWGRLANAVVPFTNARIQGLDVTTKQIKSKNPAIYKKWLFSTVGMIALRRAWMIATGTEDEYRDQPIYLKDTHNGFKVGPDTWVWIPKSHEEGLLQTAIDRVVDRAGGDDEAFEGAAQTVLNVLSPVDDIQLAGPYAVPMQARANYDLYRGKNIVPPFEADLDPSLRPGIKTASPLGQGLAQMFSGVSGKGSPLEFMDDGRKWDFVLQNQFGTAGRLATSLSKGNPKEVGSLMTGLVRSSPPTAAPVVQKVEGLMRSAGVASNPLSLFLSRYYDEQDPQLKDEAAKAVLEMAHKIDKAIIQATEGKTGKERLQAIKAVGNRFVSAVPKRKRRRDE